ncbi:MAG: GGDEF domain-containing protein, partial [Treponema sp.]|nr:GGDEF domain-containing protein [Treponema sp.]
MKNNTNAKENVKRPLSRSITVSCIIFILLLCAVLGVVTYLNYKRTLYQRYEAYISDILRYVDRHIDDDDLANCVKTLKRSEKYDELERFMDGVREDFDIHYLYILTPQNFGGKWNIMSVISAETYYDRHIDTEGNLYLGWVSDDEYDEPTVRKLYRIMNQHPRSIAFFEEKTDWGLDYTGAISLYDSEKNPYAVLALDVDITIISKLIYRHTIENFIYIILLGAVFTFAFLWWSHRAVTSPIRLLEQCVSNFAKKSHGQRDIGELEFDMPKLSEKNEVYSLAVTMSQMADDMRDYVTGILKAEKVADQMSELANRDSLTGIRNKTAYDREIKRMEYELATSEPVAFGIAMIDLNFLKRINDTYGHEQGNFAIKKLCMLVCKTFTHSPVFRIGGDEFVVILRGSDYEHVEELTAEFKRKISISSADETLEPWEKVSAAIGIAFYDKSVDASVANVFSRADQAMYECKKEM